MKKKIDKDSINFMTDFKVNSNEEEKGKIVKRKIIEMKPMNEEEVRLMHF